MTKLLKASELKMAGVLNLENMACSAREASKSFLAVLDSQQECLSFLKFVDAVIKRSLDY